MKKCDTIREKRGDKMSKIIKEPNKFKPITCAFCGCVYEFEEGDRIEALNLKYEYDGTLRFSGRMLRCPICGIANKLMKENAKG